MNNEREQQMMTAAEAYAESVGYKGENDLCATLNVFCAGWRAADNSRWIPVEEKKPPIAYHDDLSENLLVVDSDGELLIAYYDAKNELWFSVDSNPRIYDVTHWMPLPTPPQRKEE